MALDNTATPTGTTVDQAAGALMKIGTGDDKSTNQDSPEGREPEEKDEKPAGDEPEGSEKRPEGDEPEGDEPEGDEPEGEEADEPQKPKPGSDEEVVFTELDKDGNEVPVTRGEARKRGLRQSDYTKKTQEVAEERKAAKAEREAAAAKLKELGDNLDRVVAIATKLHGEEPNWEQIKAEDPEGYPARHADWTRRRQAIDKIVAERDRVMKEDAAERIRLHNEWAEAETAKVFEMIPDLKDAEKGPKLRDEMLAHAEAIGFTSEQVTKTADSRLLRMLHDSLELAKLKAEQKKLTKKSAEPEPVMKPGAVRNTKTATRQREARAATERAASTGNLDDAARALALL